MKTKKVIIIFSITLILALLIINLVSCCFLFEKKPKETRANKQSDEIAEKVEKNLIDLNTDFALKIFKQLSEESKNSNIFLSPLSISLTAAIAYNGAQNNTAAEIAEVFEFKSLPIEEFNASFKDLILSMNNIDEMVELYSANSIWCQDRFEIEKNYIDLIEENFIASIYNADFNKQQTADDINNWVKNATQNKITKIIDQASLKESVMVLLNAIYFKGQWKDKFKEENTEEGDFYLAGGDIMKVPMMHITEDFNYYEGENFQMLRMPYGRNKTSMYVLLPAKDAEANEFLKNLSGELLNEYISNSYEREIAVQFPKFEAEYSAELKNTLISLGMIDAFNEGNADFSKIAPQMFISSVAHKAIIEVNEEGTVAAAATSFGMGATAIEPVSFIVDRPFLLFIRDDRTGSILFEGKIMEP